VLDARSNLSTAGYGGVLVDRRDGADGLPEYAPYDRILLEAAAIEPPGRSSVDFADDGRLVMPLGAGEQSLLSNSAIVGRRLRPPRWRRLPTHATGRRTGRHTRAQPDSQGG